MESVGGKCPEQGLEKGWEKALKRCLAGRDNEKERKGSEGNGR
jgi:hypothetical protein